jgi:rhodanese-related sulfurtransferase
LCAVAALDTRVARSDHVAVAERVGRGVDELLADARRRITRAAPEDAWVAANAGEALIVDIRSGDERRADGIVPGSLHVPRTVLEWRFDGTSGWGNSLLQDRGRRVLLLCAHGFSSSLAAATLVELGFDAGDDAGGFEAWVEASLPTRAAAEPVAGVLPGMGGLD